MHFNRVNSGEQVLNKLVQTTSLSEAGKDWFLCNTDPFHDKELPQLFGYPDSQVGSSITQKVPLELEVSMPPGISGNWKALVVTYPITHGTSGEEFCNHWKYGNQLEKLIDQKRQGLFPVTVYIGPTENDLGPTGVNTLITGLGLPDQLTTGSMRVVGWGLEIHNTTADIYKQGAITAFRQNCSTVNKQVFQSWASSDGVVAIEKSIYEGTMLRRPPKNVNEANQLMNTRTWKAADGLYQVVTMNEESNIAKMPGYTQPVILDWDTRAGAITIGEHPDPSVPCIAPITVPAVFGATGVVPTGATWGPQTSWNFQPYHQSGCFLSGLSPQSTFILRVNWYVERFPTPSEQDLVYNTKPSAHYDPMALRLMGEALRAMPVGVPVGENPLGEWFWKTVSNVLPFLEKANIPVVSALASLGKSGIDMYNDYRQHKTLPKNQLIAGGNQTVTRTVVKKPRAKNKPKEVVTTTVTTAKKPRKRKKPNRAPGPWRDGYVFG